MMLGLLQYFSQREQKEFSGVVWPGMDGRGRYTTTCHNNDHNSFQWGRINKNLSMS
jgi:hypothetical protein